MGWVVVSEEDTRDRVKWKGKTRVVEPKQREDEGEKEDFEQMYRLLNFRINLQFNIINII